MSSTRPRSIAFVGGGPRTVGLLERLSANAAELLGPAELHIHIIDPYPAGGGRIWRTAQSELLWMNSMARDVTIFTDESVTCAGPIVTGPALDEWVKVQGKEILAAAGLADQAEALGPDDFASRQIQSHYLKWAHDRAVRSLPPQVVVTEHRTEAVGVQETASGQRILLADGGSLTADVVVLAQGFLDREPTAEENGLSSAAKQCGLTYIPPGYTADVDLSGLRAGEPVLVRGFGLAFIDLMVLVGQGRGGRFSEAGDASLTYHPSGAEPVLYVGSRRGVPYHAKLGYALPGRSPTPPQYFTPAAVAALAGGRRRAGLPVGDLAADRERTDRGALSAIVHGHPERTLIPWPEFSDILDRADVTAESFALAAEQAVPKREDRFDLPVIDRPLAQNQFGSFADLQTAVVEYIGADIHRRADPYFSADAAVFDALLTVYGVLAIALTTGQISPADRVRYVEGEFHGLFSFLASGPPPRRLAELLALHRAGLVHFAGPQLRIDVSADGFVGSSPAAPGVIHARALVDARLPRPDVRTATDPVIRSLLAAGELAAEDLTGPDGQPLVGGQLLADANCRAVRPDGSVHPRRFLLGPSVSGSAGSAGFSRPGFNGPGFRQNDAVARQILQLLQEPIPTTPFDSSRTSDSQRSQEIHHAR